MGQELAPERLGRRRQDPVAASILRPRVCRPATAAASDRGEFAHEFFAGPGCRRMPTPVTMTLRPHRPWAPALHPDAPTARHP